jgi:hypothetical protein
MMDTDLDKIQVDIDVRVVEMEEVLKPKKFIFNNKYLE